MAIFLMLITSGLLAGVIARHVQSSQIRYRAELSAELRSAADLVWGQVDQWIAGQVSRASGSDAGIRVVDEDDVGFAVDDADKLRVPNRDHDPTDPDSEIEVIAEIGMLLPDLPDTWRVARTGSSRFAPGEELPENCDDDDLEGSLAICWRIDSIIRTPSYALQQALNVDITVGIWCSAEPDPDGAEGMQGCEEFAYESRRYLHRGFTRFGLHYHTAVLPVAERDPGVAKGHPLWGFLSTSAEIPTVQEFWSGYTLLSSIHTNDPGVVVCGEIPVVGDAEVSANQPDTPLSADPGRGILLTKTPGVLTSLGCQAAGLVDSSDSKFIEFYSDDVVPVQSSELLVETGLASEQPWCTAARPDGAHGRKEYYLPPGGGWLADALALAVASDTVVEPGKPDGVGVLGFGDPSVDLGTLLFGDPSVDWDALAAVNSRINVDDSSKPFLHPLLERRKLAVSDPDIRVSLLDLATVKDGEVWWSSQDPLFVTGALPASVDATVAAAGSIVLVPKEIDRVGAGTFGDLSRTLGVDSALSVGSAGESEGTLALLAGCHINVAPIVSDLAARPSKVLVNRVAALAPAGFVFAESHAACLQGIDLDPCPVLFNACLRNNIFWVGSIGARYKPVFGQHSRDGKLVSGFCETVSSPYDWRVATFPWWPKVRGGAWQPA